jgi:hypothetical protein
MDVQVLILCAELKDAFLETPEFACFSKESMGFSINNEHAYMQGRTTPDLQFDLNNKLSDSHILTVRPGIRDSRLSVNITLQFMRDGRGIQSTTWDTKYEDTIEVDENSDITIETLAERARNMAIQFHTKLIEEVGITDGAKEIAEKAWPVEPSLQALRAAAEAELADPCNHLHHC